MTLLSRKTTPALGLAIGVVLLASVAACGSPETAPAARPAPGVAASRPSPTIEPQRPSAPLSAATAAVAVGTRVGERVPDFQMRLTDGGTVSLDTLLAEGSPVFLYFFASW